MSVSGLSSGEVALGARSRPGWWLVDDEEPGPGRIVAGPFADRTDAEWAAGSSDISGDGVRAVYGVGRADGGLTRRASPQDGAWLAHLEEQFARLPEGWDGGLSDDDPVATLVVELVAALSEAGLPLHDPTGARREAGGICLSPEPVLGGVVVTWRQHDRMSVGQIHGAAADTGAQQVLNRALADVLRLRGFDVDAFAGGSGHVVRLVG